MNLKTIGQLAGAVLLTAALAGCIDVTMDVEVLNDTTGKATTTMVMGADFYAMAKAGMNAPPAEGQTAPAPAQEGFCEEEGAVLTENADGSATCVIVAEGKFEEIMKSEGEENPARFEVVSPGVVKVIFPTKDMMGEMGAEQADEQTKAMMAALFADKNITIRVRGKQITETNMTLSADKTSAEIVIPFLDLVNGTATLPEELTATVNTN